MTAFSLQQTLPLASLDASALAYQHPSGLQHYHLDLDSSEMTFYLAFKTLPERSDGIAHILEHTTLCGSKSYPVRDPFFSMLRRSVNTFMNAMTSSDWTCYPFASRNEADYFNLMQIYMDAVFNPKLSYESFRQEGHRLEKQNPENQSENNWHRTGVVFNEMIGANSSLSSRVWNALSQQHFSGTGYDLDSGGDPSIIPLLTHKELKNFHAQRYQLANAIAFSSGPKDSDLAAVVQKKLQDYIDTELKTVSTPEVQKKATTRIQTKNFLNCSYPEQTTQDADVVLVSWQLENIQDNRALVENTFLDHVLLMNASSPLRASLEASNLGKGVYGYTGLIDTSPNQLFAAGLSGVNQDTAHEEIEQLIIKSLEDIVAKGIDQEAVDLAIQAMEFDVKDIDTSYPLGLKLGLELLNNWTSGGDNILDRLAIEKDLKSLKPMLKDPAYCKDLIQRKLIQTKPKVLRMQADSQLAEQERRIRESQVESTISQLAPSDKNSLEQEQGNHRKWALEREEDLSCLPSIDYTDLTPNPFDINPVNIAPGRYFGTAPTNGIIELKGVIPMPIDLNKSMHYWGMYVSMFGELGFADHDYKQAQMLWDKWFGSITFSPELLQLDDGSLHLGLSVKAKMLPNQLENGLTQLSTALASIRFDETDRIATLLKQRAVGYQSNIWSAAHQLAMLNANADPLSQLKEQISGLSGRKKLKAQANEHCQHLSELFSTWTQSHKPGQFMMVCSPDQEAMVKEAFLKWDMITTDQALQGQTYEAISEGSQLWHASPDSNYCAYSFSVDTPVGSAITAHCQLLAEYLRHEYLTPKMREQGGAYGAGTSYNPRQGLFGFFTYRDPRCKDSYTDFSKAFDYVLEHGIQQDDLNLAKLVCINALDERGERKDDLYEAFQRIRLGREITLVQASRAHLYAATSENLLQAAAYLKSQYQHGRASAIVNENVANKPAESFPFESVKVQQI